METALEFTIVQKTNNLARAALIKTPHGTIETPAFIVAGTKAAVKALSVADVQTLGGQAILANTYHLLLQPGPELIAQAGGLAKFMAWNAPTFTDSGGFQIFSLGQAYDRGLKATVERASIGARQRLQINDEGVLFRSHINGDVLKMTPEISMLAQHQIGADIHMAFDQLVSPSSGQSEVKMALERTHAWADRCLAKHHELNQQHLALGQPLQALFGVVQGGHDEKLRCYSAEFMAARDFDGFGIGGVFVPEEIPKYVALVNRILPENKPRHLLGMGAQPLDIFLGVENGVDTFDCVAPTRQARNGALYTAFGRLNILNSRFKDDFSPIDETCDCPVCQGYSKSYLHHLFKANEILASMLASQHNEYFVLNLTRQIRQSLLDDNFDNFKDYFLRRYYH